LAEQKEEFESKGLNVAAVSYDSPAVLKHFADRAGVEYPLLADTDSEVIRAFGILNERIPEDHRFYGIPNPGYYVIDENGIVQSKYFEERYQDRFTSASILVREFDDPGEVQGEAETPHLRVSWSASNREVLGGNRVSLILHVSMKPKMHVYAPDVTGYLPVDWEMTSSAGWRDLPPEFPESKLLHLPAIDEIVPVYEGRFRVVRDVEIGANKQLRPLVNADGTIAVEGVFHYQACDDKVCYLPQQIPLKWTFGVNAYDRQRAPESLRR
jgi:hypothetical protein